MHPVIRIISVLVTIAFLAHPEPGVLLFVTSILLLYALSQDSIKLGELVHYIRSLRWLLITIVILYMWMTPGMPLFESEYVSPYLVPSIEGLQIALQRVISLLLIVCMVVLLIVNMIREELLAALCWLTRPLQIFRLDYERLSLRLMLVLDIVPEAKTMVSSSIHELLKEKPGIRKFSHVFSSVYKQVLIRAEQTEPRNIEIPEISAPRAIQWLMPAGLIIVFILLNRL
jgi:energy-coupling factor transport system permease protein